MVSVGGAVYKSIKIKTIKPNRLKSKHFQTSYTFFAYPNTSNLEVAWLHGAVAKI
jgi:hypothetical protein